MIVVFRAAKGRAFAERKTTIATVIAVPILAGTISQHQTEASRLFGASILGGSRLRFGSVWFADPLLFWNESVEDAVDESD